MTVAFTAPIWSFYFSLFRKDDLQTLPDYPCSHKTYFADIRLNVYNNQQIEFSYDGIKKCKRMWWSTRLVLIPCVINLNSNIFWYEHTENYLNQLRQNQRNNANLFKIRNFCLLYFFTESSVRERQLSYLGSLVALNAAMKNKFLV